MAALPGGVLWNPRWMALDVDGVPLPLAKLYSYETGGTFSTPKFLYANSTLATPLTNPVVADADGRFPEMFMLPDGYDLALKEADGTAVWTALDVEDIGQSFLSELGNLMADGARDVASGYTVLDTDNLITTDSADATNPFIVNLQPAADRGLPITIKHQSAFACSITPDGAETIDGVAAAFSIAAAATPNFPTVTLVPDGAGGYLIQSSHGL